MDSRTSNRNKHAGKSVSPRILLRALEPPTGYGILSVPPFGCLSFTNPFTDPRLLRDGYALCRKTKTSVSFITGKFASTILCLRRSRLLVSGEPPISLKLHPVVLPGLLNCTSSNPSILFRCRRSDQVVSPKRRIFKVHRAHHACVPFWRSVYRRR